MTDSPDLHHNHRLRLEYEPVDAIKANPRDPRTYSPRETKRVAKSMITFGVMPLIVNSDRVVLSGNIWLEAAKLSGAAHVPVVVADHLTPAQAEAFMVAQIRLVELGEWDTQRLGEILRDLTLQELDFDLEIIGFDAPQIDLYIEGIDQQTDGPDPADEAPPAGPAVTRPGDLWILGPHRILCGDSLAPASYETLMAGDLAAIVFADPPYNVAIAGNVSGKGAVKHDDFAMACGEMSEAEFQAFLTQVMGLAANHSAEGSLAYWCMDWRHMSEITTAGRSAYKALLNLCVWTKTNGGQGSLYRSQHELVFVFKKSSKPHRNNVQMGKHGRHRTNVWTYPGISNFGRRGEEGDLLAMHPTVKPVALIADALLDASARGDIVLDGFMGSGSTMIAAEKVGRRARGIELDPAYVDTAIRRWERWSGEEARLEGTGQTFADIGVERAVELANV